MTVFRERTLGFKIPVPNDMALDVQRTAWRWSWGWVSLKVWFESTGPLLAPQLARTLDAGATIDGTDRDFVLRGFKGKTAIATKVDNQGDRPFIARWEFPDTDHEALKGPVERSFAGFARS